MYILALYTAPSMWYVEANTAQNIKIYVSETWRSVWHKFFIRTIMIKI